METLLDAIKIAGVLLGAVLGIVGTKHDFKSRGKLTTWGKLTIAGIILGGLLAIGAQLVENRLEAIASESAAARNLQPLRDAKVNVKLSFPMDHPDLIEYRHRLDTAVSQTLAGIKKNNKMDVPGNKGLSVLIQREDVYVAEGKDDYAAKVLKRVLHPPTGLLLDSSHEYYPQVKDAKCAELLRSLGSGHIYVFRQPVPTADLSLPKLWKADLWIKFDKPEAEWVWWDSEAVTGRYGMQATVAAVEENWHDNTGRVLSVPDLLNSQIFLEFGPWVPYKDTEPGSCPGRIQIAKAAGLERAILSFGRRDIEIDGRHFRQVFVEDVGFVWELAPGRVTGAEAGSL